MRKAFAKVIIKKKVMIIVKKIIWYLIKKNYQLNF